MQGLPTIPIILTAIGLVLILPLKTWLYFFITSRFGLRSRTSLLNAITLGNFSEFGLIVAALGVSQGFLSVEWLLVIAVSISFATAAPFSKNAEGIYQSIKRLYILFKRYPPSERQGVRYRGSYSIDHWWCSGNRSL